MVNTEINIDLLATNPESLLQEFQTNAVQGLTTTPDENRLHKFGKNKIDYARAKTNLKNKL